MEIITYTREPGQVYDPSIHPSIYLALHALPSMVLPLLLGNLTHTAPPSMNAYALLVHTTPNLLQTLYIIS